MIEVKAASRKYYSGNYSIRYGIDLAIPEGFKALFFPNNNIARKNLILLYNEPIKDEEGDLIVEFKSVKNTGNWKQLGKKRYIDLTSSSTKDKQIVAEWFKDDLLEEVDEDTPHGEHGVTEHFNYYKVEDLFYRAEVTNIEWDRLDKQYYFRDPYSTPKFSMEIVQEEDLPDVKVKGIYEVGEVIGQVILIPLK